MMSKSTKELNQLLSKSKKIGINEIKQYKGLENIEENEARNIVESLYVLAELLLTINTNNHE